MKSFIKCGAKAAVLMVTLVLALAMVPAAFATVSSTVNDENTAPVAENLEYATYKNVAISGTLQAIDPEGDMMEFKLITQPKKGEAQITQEGEFTYTPIEGKKGKDKFTYVAVDSMGNVSDEATVVININKQSTKVTYSDMDGHASHFAALRMAEEGIFVGEMIGENYYFNPDAVVTRGEFLAICLNATGEQLLEDIYRTGFSDDENIAMWLKPYVTTAIMSGIIKGMDNAEGGVVFAPNGAITTAQAAMMIDRMIGVPDVVSTVPVADSSVPTWAFQATANLSAYGIIDSDSGDVYTSELTRSQVAEIIMNTLDAMGDDAGEPLLSWAQ